MNYWLFTVVQKKPEQGWVTADEIFQQRLVDKFWGLGERTPNRRYLQKGDRIVFYVGIPAMTFAALATLASDSFMVSDAQKEQYSHGKSYYRADFGVLLDEIRVLDPPRLVKDLIPILKFIENKRTSDSLEKNGHVICP